METWEAEMQRIEETVRKSDGDGLRARWESGRYMLTLKKGKQLPSGMLDELADTLEVHRSELTARMKFASKFATEDELADVISKFKTWFAITHEALTDTPRNLDDHEDQEDAADDVIDYDAEADKCDEADHRRARSSLLRVIKVIGEIDAAMLNEKDQELLVMLYQNVQRLKDAVSTIAALQTD